MTESPAERGVAGENRLLRLMVATKAPASEYPLDALAELGESPAPVRLKV